MSERTRYDVAIVGGGLVGASAALGLARRGLRVGLFERRYCGAQASGVNYGGVRCQVLPDFEKANNVKAVVVPGTSSDILAKLLANKSNPQIHVVFLDDGVMARAVGMGVCRRLDDDAPAPASAGAIHNI